jgi:hypothetical protein
MGAVHEVVHEVTGVHYALKTLHSTLLSEIATEDLERFRREAEVMAQLDHPNVGRIHSAHLEGPEPYLVQDLLTGGTLSDRLADGPLDPDQAVELTIKLARGLEHCHAAGVLHRDLKPENVMFDDRGEPRLVDFGLALTPAQSERLTESGAVLGTPSYMSPEQVRGRHGLDQRVDVYGLGALLYATLTGRAPFQGTLFQVLDQVVNKAPQPLCALRPELPPAVERICLRALAKDPGDRYPDMAGFAAALEHWRDAPATRAGPPARYALAGAALLGSLLLGLWLVSRGDEPEDPTASAQVSQVDDQEAPSPSARARPRWRRGTLAVPGDSKWCVGAFVGGDVAAVTDRGRVYVWTGNDSPPQYAGGFNPGRSDDSSSGGFIARYAEHWISCTGGAGSVALRPLDSPHGGAHLDARARTRPALFGSRLAIPIEDPPTVALFDLDTRERVMTIGPLRSFPGVVAFGPGGSWLAVALGREGKVRGEVSIWDVRSSDSPTLLVAHRLGDIVPKSLGVRQRGVQPAAAQIVVGGAFYALQAWSFDGQEVVASTELKPTSEASFSSIRGLAFSPKGDFLYSIAASKSRDYERANRVTAWDPDSGAELGTLPRGVQLTSLAISDDGELLLLGTVKGELQLVDARRLREGRRR